MLGQRPFQISLGSTGLTYQRASMVAWSDLNQLPVVHGEASVRCTDVLIATRCQRLCGWEVLD